MQGETSSRLRDGARVIAPLLPAVVAFGVSYGLLARAAGMGAVAPVVMSATTYAGSAQFAVASILDDAGSIAAAIAAAVLLNARYAPMSIAAGASFEGSPWRRLVTAQLIVDESWALSARSGGRFDLPVLLGAGLTLYPCWLGATVVGVAVGESLGDPERLGLDAAFAALFFALLVGFLRTRRTVLAAAAGSAIALALMPFAPEGLPIVAGAAACLLGLRR